MNTSKVNWGASRSRRVIEGGNLLIPVYIVGFIIGGLVCFAIAQHVSNRRVRIAIQMLGVAAGPVFFIVVAIFSSQQREKTYETEWLTEKPAAEYYIHEYRHEHFNGGEQAPDPEGFIILKRKIDHDRECLSSFHSTEIAHYLEGLPTHTVIVRYTAIYDFYQLRTYGLESIGDFGKDPATKGKLGGIEVFETQSHKDTAVCLAY